MLCSFACPIVAVPKLTPQTPQVEWLNKRSAPAAQMFHAPAAEQLPKALAKEQLPVAPAAEQLPQANLGQKGPRHVPASSAMAWLNSDAFGPRLDLDWKPLHPQMGRFPHLRGGAEMNQRNRRIINKQLRCVKWRKWRKWRADSISSST